VKLQKQLSENGYNVGPIDGVFGSKTEAAVLKYQEDKGLNADGVVGDQTWNSLFQESIPKSASLDRPPSQNRCFEVFGNHQLAGWDQQNLVRCDLSMFREKLEHVYYDKAGDMVLAHRDWFGFMCHRLVAPKFQQAFKNVIDRGLAGQIKTFGGCLNKRKVRGGNEWSMHSWGIAIDINVQWNQFGQKNFQMSEELAKCFEDVGFVWGGRWTGWPDAMHFQYATVR
jgi:hypothetical protein